MECNTDLSICEKSFWVFGGVELAVGCLSDAVSTGGKTAVTGRASAGGLDRRSEG